MSTRWCVGVAKQRELLMNASMMNHNLLNTAAGQLDEAIARRKSWEENEEKTANELLYSILGDCLSMYESYRDSKDKKAWKQDLQNVADTQGVKLMKGKVLRNIARVVFGMNEKNRKRVSNYARALEVAHADGVMSADLCEWIKQQGGVIEVTRRAPEQSAPIKKWQFVQSQLEPKAIVRDASVSQLVNVDSTEELVVVLAKRKSDGSMEYYDVVSSGTPVRAALEALYTTYKKKIQTAAQAANDEALEGAIEKARATAA